MYKSPCINCTERELMCHSKCRRYFIYKKNIDTIKEKIKKEKQLNINSKATFFSY